MANTGTSTVDGYEEKLFRVSGPVIACVPMHVQKAFNFELFIGGIETKIKFIFYVKKTSQEIH